MAEVRKVNAQEKASKIIEIIEQDGCVVLENALSETEIKRLRNDVLPHLDAIPDCEGDFYGYETKRLGALFSKSKIFQKMAIIPNILEVMDHYLLQSCSQYQINLTQAISIGPEEKKQIMHQDDPMFPFLHPGYEAMINCMWAVDDFTEENGATVIVPGSHKWPRSQSLNLEYEDLPPHMITKGVMKKGSVLIYLGSLFHCGGANTTDSRRCGAVISYCLGWLRQAENNYLAYSKEELKDMPENLQKMLGYFVHEPNLGSVNGIDPYDYYLNDKQDELFTEFIPESAQPLIKEYRERLQSKVA